MGNANLSGDAPWSVFFLALVKDFWRALALLSPERFENVCAFFKERLSR